MKKPNEILTQTGLSETNQNFLGFNDPTNVANNFQFSRFLEEMSTEKQPVVQNANMFKKKPAAPHDLSGSVRNTSHDDGSQQQQNFMNASSNYRLNSTNSRSNDLSAKFREQTNQGSQMDQSDKNELGNIDQNIENLRQQNLLRQTKYRQSRYKSPFQPIRAVQKGLNSSFQAAYQKNDLTEHAALPPGNNTQLASTQFSSQFSNQPQNSFFNSTSINFSGDVSKSLEEEDAIVEEMHYYFVEFQQKSKEWLRKIETNL